LRLPTRLLFIAVLFVVRFHRLLSMTSRMDYMRPRYVGVVRRFLVMSGLVVLCCLTVMTGSVSKMFLHLLVVFSGFFRHCRFLPGLEFVCDQSPSPCRPANLCSKRSPA
jgi:hypothetical protein